MKLLFLTRRSTAFIALLYAVLLACEARATTSDSGNDSGTTPRTSRRERAVRGVPIEHIRAAIDSLLRGSPPASIDADTWRHVRGLYRGNEGNPYWMTEKGLDRQRAGQLTNVVVASVKEALNPSELPLAATVEALDVVRGRQTPTAAAMARADVLMTALYAGIAEQRLVGHVDPRSVVQSWYIDPRETGRQCAGSNAASTTHRSGPGRHAAAPRRLQRAAC
jgi:hypothetical protein